MSKVEDIGVSPSQVGCHNKSYSGPKQGTLGQSHGLGAESKHAGQLEWRDPLGIDIVETELEDSAANSGNGPDEPFKSPAKDVTGDILHEDPHLPPEAAHHSSMTDKISSPKLNARHKKLDFGSECLQSELGPESAHGGPLKGNDPVGSISTQSSARGTSNTVLGSVANDTLQSLPADVAKNSVIEYPGMPYEDAQNGNQVDKSLLPRRSTQSSALGSPSDGDSSEPLDERQTTDFEPLKMITASPACIVSEHPERTIVLDLPHVNESNILSREQLISSHNEVENPSSLKKSETTPNKNLVGNSGRMGQRVKRTPKSSRKKYMLRSLVGSKRVLRSRSRETSKAPVTCNNLAKANSTGEKKRRRKKRRGTTVVVADEYLRIRRHLRYLLNRMNYEQSLIVAYSGEGWKGLSLEKLKPEKELQRAASEILRRKLKIRDLFRRIDSLCAEGRPPDSLFDSEGQISSEDIFCAKCSSKDLTADNDIILCDGACDRGFHQFCLVPPLLKEDVPPDDEGWLCPGCDCKVDCIDLLNDSQRTKLSIADSWEKVFPEASAAAAGQNLDKNLRLPSDDSDDDYDPDGVEIEEKKEDESTSDESDFTSSSDEQGASPDDQYLGLPSDDPEDDDYDPDAPVCDDNVKEESSSSDFTSDSEDLAAAIDDNALSEEDEDQMCLGPQKNGNAQSSKFGGKKESLNSELLHSIEQDTGQDGLAPVLGRRNVERLDYKKLYDETYGNASSDSSEDEDYSDMVRSGKRRKSAGKKAVSGDGNDSLIMTIMNENAVKEDTNVLSAKTREGSSVSGCSSKKVRSSSYRKLGEATTQKLQDSFKKNQYPDRAVKESLAKELGLTFQQVDKWFGNARWSFNHPSK